ncbi:MAG: hypothetical protein HOV92_00685 [Streptomyces sp.]|nr:hypothetical protein [Streptomyces sp.]
MNTKLVNTAADVINAALTQNRTAAGIALALDSAQLLQSPETAKELERLRVEVASLKVAVEAPELCADCGHQEDAHSVDGETDCMASGARLLKCSCSYFIPRYGAAELVVEPVAAPLVVTEDMAPQVRKLRALLAGQRLATEDPFGLHHDYRVSRDLPQVGEQPC